MSTYATDVPIHLYHHHHNTIEEEYAPYHDADQGIIVDVSHARAYHHRYPSKDATANPAVGPSAKQPSSYPHIQLVLPSSDTTPMATSAMSLPPIPPYNGHRRQQQQQQQQQTQLGSESVSPVAPSPPAAQLPPAHALPTPISTLIAPQRAAPVVDIKDRLTVHAMPSQTIVDGKLVIGHDTSISVRSYTPLKNVGDGSFGTVVLADWHSPLPPGVAISPMQLNIKSSASSPNGSSSSPDSPAPPQRLVAIKRMKKRWSQGWSECAKLQELKSLRDIAPHPNIIPLYDAFLMPDSRELHFVFECMEGNLYQLIKSRKGRPLAGGLVASIYRQCVLGLLHTHESGYFHRDMKPENLLVTTTGLADYSPTSPLCKGPPSAAPPEKDVMVIIKLADFGLAREIKSSPPYTEYVSTRWYRAPEVLLRSRDYSVPVDMWALGTIMAELANLKPIFPGQNEVDQVARITEVLGDPTREEGEYGYDDRGRVIGGGAWLRGIRMARGVGFTFPKIPPIAFNSLFEPTCPSSLIDCILDCIRYDPAKRLTAQQCKDHPYWKETENSMRSPITVQPTVQQHESVPPHIQQMMDRDRAERQRLGRPPDTNTSSTSSNKSLRAAVAGMGIGSPDHHLHNQRSQDHLGGGRRSSQYMPTGSGYPGLPLASPRNVPPSHSHPFSAEQNRPFNLAGGADGGVMLPPIHQGGSEMFSPPSDAGSDATALPQSKSQGSAAWQYAQASQAHYESQHEEDGRDGHDEAPMDISNRNSLDMSVADFPLPPINDGHSNNQSNGKAAPPTQEEAPAAAPTGRKFGLKASFGLGKKHNTFGFLGKDTAPPPPPPAMPASSSMPIPAPSNSLKRGPSQSTGSLNEFQQYNPPQGQQQPPPPPPPQQPAPVPIPANPKEAKKLAEKLKKEEQRAAYEAKQRLAKERSRAVVQKRKEAEAAGLLGNSGIMDWDSNGSLTMIKAASKGKGKEPERAPAPGNNGGQLGLTIPGRKVAGPETPSARHLLSPDEDTSAHASGSSRTHHNGAHRLHSHHPSGHAMAGNLDPSGRYVTHPYELQHQLHRHKARRRDTDDDHSMSSSDMASVSRMSMASFSTVDSDPGPGRHHHRMNGAQGQQAFRYSERDGGGINHAKSVSNLRSGSTYDPSQVPPMPIPSSSYDSAQPGMSTVSPPMQMLSLSRSSPSPSPQDSRTLSKSMSRSRLRAPTFMNNLPTLPPISSMHSPTYSNSGELSGGSDSNNTPPYELAPANQYHHHHGASGSNLNGNGQMLPPFSHIASIAEQSMSEQQPPQQGQPYRLSPT
ncbi:hypothetical protein FRB95_006257 [Tulasnella sp. JGI-2019a]|nr:hypothetical protein FRB95_006257 [Tulasnella sp. JGI-2019a]